MKAYEKWVIQQGAKATYLNKKPLKDEEIPTFEQWKELNCTPDGCHFYIYKERSLWDYQLYQIYKQQKLSKMKAYEKWIIQQGTKAAYLNKKPLKETIAQLLFREVKYNQNKQAFEILEQVGDKYFTDTTFEKAADILIDKSEQAT